MSNIRGLYDDKKDEPKDDERDSNNRYVGGIGAQGGGSGLAVEPNNADAEANSRNASDSIFGQAEGDHDNSTSSSNAIRRTITMYRDGFVVDDGPYRRLDDPSNAGFLRSLARGQTPDELRGDGPGGSGTANANNTTVGLVDKRKEDYVETFRSFSGAGQSLVAGNDDAPGGGASAAASGTAAASGVFVFDPSAPPPSDASPPAASTTPTTSIAVRMLDGSRKVVTIAPTATVRELASSAVSASNSTISVPFRIVAGFPPKPLCDGDQTVEEAGLKGARVQLQKA